MLASGSPARLRLLHAAGFDPTVIVSGVPEDDVALTDPADLVSTLAVRKARAVAAGDAAAIDGAVVLGCDSTLLLDGVALGKPGSADAAAERWRAMRGRRGELLTGHCLIDLPSGREAVAVGRSTVHFADLDDDEIAAYVASGEPLEVAGGFTIDGRGALFVERVDGDPSNVIGLSLPLLRELLQRLGIPIMELWR